MMDVIFKLGLVLTGMDRKVLEVSSLELQTKVREDFTITEKAPIRAYSPTRAFTFETLRKQALTHSK